MKAANQIHLNMYNVHCVHNCSIHIKIMKKTNKEIIKMFPYKNKQIYGVSTRDIVETSWIRRRVFLETKCRPPEATMETSRREAILSLVVSPADLHNDISQIHRGDKPRRPGGDIPAGVPSPAEHSLETAQRRREGIHWRHSRDEDEPEPSRRQLRDFSHPTPPPHPKSPDEVGGWPTLRGRSESAAPLPPCPAPLPAL